MSSWTNKITGHGEVDPKSLVENKKNWRCHPGRQKQAMAGALTELGWIDEITVNETTGRVVDGHLRVALAIQNGQPTVPVRYVRLTEQEEAYALATKDPIGSQAEADTAKLDQLIEELETRDFAVQKLLQEVSDGRLMEVIATTSVEIPLPSSTQEQERPAGQAASLPLPVATSQPASLPSPAVASDLDDIEDDLEDGDEPPVEPAAASGMSVIGPGAGSSMNFLRWGKQAVPMTSKEEYLLEEAYKLHCAESGTSYGFVTWFLQHVRSRLPN